MKFGNVLAGLGRADWQGATRTLNDTMDSASNRRTAEINRDNMRTQGAISQIQLRDMEEEQKRKNTFLPESVLRNMMSNNFSAGTVNQMIEDMKKTDLWEQAAAGQGMRQINLDTFKKMSEENTVFTQKYQRMELENSEMKGQEIQRQIKEADPQDTETISQLNKALEENNKEIVGMAGRMEDTVKKAERMRQTQKNKAILQQINTNPRTKQLNEALAEKYPAGLDVIKMGEQALLQGDPNYTIEKHIEVLQHLVERTGKDSQKQYEMKTVYGPGRRTKIVPVEKGIEYTPPTGWTLESPEKPEREKRPELQTLFELQNPQHKGKSGTQEYGKAFAEWEIERVQGKKSPSLIGQLMESGSVEKRFKNDPAMKGKKLGKKTPKGYEVFDGDELKGYYH